MNSKELEALVLKQGDELARVRTWAVEALENTRTLHELALKQAEIITALQEAANKSVDPGQFELLKESGDEVRRTSIEALEESMKHGARLETLEKLVLARNASAPTKRNMTDEDALRVMTGDLRELAHKDAAEKIGLTYAQVYSCRLEFTFKHIHKTLRDGATHDAPWSNPWSK